MLRLQAYTEHTISILLTGRNWRKSLLSDRIMLTTFQQKKIKMLALSLFLKTGKEADVPVWKQNHRPNQRC